MHFDLLDPVFYLFEGLSVINGVCHDDSHGPSIVSLRDGFEPFLAGGIPDLQPDLFVIDVDGFYFEVDALLVKNRYLWLLDARS